MQLLAISTSGPVATAALLCEGAVLDVRAGAGGAHSETLLPAVDALLDAQGLSIADIDLFAADVGPGSFTGVRIGVSTANAMAAARSKPVIGISSLEALAYGLPGRVCPLLDARNGNCYAACYQDGLCLTPPCSMETERFLHNLCDADVTFVGDVEAFAALLASYAPQSQALNAHVSAQGIALAAWAAYLRGETAREIMPLYLRPSQAERLHGEKQP